MTKLNYLDNTYLFESKAIFVEIRENEKGKAVILDETIFYPQ
jgi:alanyl-tRNA synthetase